MPDVQPAAIEAPAAYASLADLRAAHIGLMRAVRGDGPDADRLEKIQGLLGRAKATGRRLDSPADRDAAQNILTYWASHLFSAGDRRSLDAALPVLDPFDPSNAPDLSKVASPFQGLAPFGEKDAARFLGREQAVKTVLDRLEHMPILLIGGPIGSGKTSLVRAGLVPRIKARLADAGAQPVFLFLQPGADPFTALLKSVNEAGEGAKLQSASAWIAAQKAKLERSPDLLAALLAETFATRPVYLIVDHFEDLFTLKGMQEEREQFARALAAAAPGAESPNRCILILDDRYCRQAFTLAALKPLDDNEAAIYQLPALQPSDVIRIIESAAASVGLKFDEGIAEDLAKDAAGDVGALPALQFTLGKLWDARQGDRISWEAYRRIGRPRDALRRAAEAIYESLPAEEQAAARKLFLAMVHPTLARGIYNRWRVRRDTLAQMESADGMPDVLDRYVQAGLIRQTPGASWDDDAFEVAHEALVDNWPRLRAWLEDEQEASEKKLQFLAMARRWRESGEDAGYLLTGDVAIDEAESYKAGYPELIEFVAASRRADRRQQQRKITLYSSALVIMAALAAIAVVGWSKAISAKRQATDSAFKALKATDGIVRVVHSQRDAGVIPIKAAIGVLNEAKETFDAVEERPELREVLVDPQLQLSDAYFVSGDREEALQLAEAADKLTTKFLAEEPNSSKWLGFRFQSAYRLGDIIVYKDRDKALANYQTALAALLLAAKQHADGGTSKPESQARIAFVENKIGDVFEMKKQYDLSLDHYRNALAIGERIAADRPDDPESQKTVGDAHKRIGDLFARQKHFDLAYPEYQAALAIEDTLAKRSPENAVYQSNLAKGHHQLGSAYQQDMKPDEALKQFTDALAIRVALAQEDPDNAEWQRALATEYMSLGELLKETDPDGALDDLRRATGIRDRLAAKQPENLDWLRNAAVSHVALAEALVQNGQYDAAASEYQALAKIRATLASADPNSPDLARELAGAFERLGDTFAADAAHRQAAGDAYQKAIDGLDNFSQAHPDSSLKSLRDTIATKKETLANAGQ